GSNQVTKTMDYLGPLAHALSGYDSDKVSELEEEEGEGYSDESSSKEESDEPREAEEE
ncbi:hypothetical protein KI387_019892, partial [Taxus chinensis]